MKGWLKMKKRRFFILFLLMLGSLSMAAGECRADWRRYVWTYEYMTMAKGSFEAEFYFTHQVIDLGRGKLDSLKPQIEIEYGISDKWDVALYQQFSYKNKPTESDFSYDGFKIRNRYKIGEKDKYWFDPLIYMEFIRSADYSAPSQIEGKLVLAKDIGEWNIAYNQIIKRDLENSGKTSHEYACGISWGWGDHWQVGIESKGDYSDQKYASGPTVSYGAGRFWMAAGAAFGLNQKTDDLQTRLIIGIPF